MNTKLVDLNDGNFINFLSNSEKVCLVDFWAEWCNPCRIMLSSLEEISNNNEFSDKLSILKLNIDKNPIITQKYNIRSIPTLILFNKEKILGTKIGLLSKTELLDFVKFNILM